MNTESNTPATDAVAAARKALEEAEANLRAQEQAHKDAIEAEATLKRNLERLAAHQAAHAERRMHMMTVLVAVQKLLPDAGFILEEQLPALEEDKEAFRAVTEGFVRIGRKDDPYLYMRRCGLALQRRIDRSRRWRSVGTKEWQFTLGSYGNKITYPQKKDGTFSYAKIATELATRYTAQLAKQIHERTQQDKVNASAALVKAMAVPEAVKTGYGPVRVMESGATVGDVSLVRVKVDFTSALTAEAATEFVNAVNALLATVRSVAAVVALPGTAPAVATSTTVQELLTVEAGKS